MFPLHYIAFSFCVYSLRTLLSVTMILILLLLVLSFFCFTEASNIIDVEDARHIVQNDKLLGDRVDEIVKEWDAQKEAFYEKTGVRRDELAVVEHDESGVLPHENDEFDEIRQLLLE